MPKFPGSVNETQAARGGHRRCIMRRAELRVTFRQQTVGRVRMCHVGRVL